MKQGNEKGENYIRRNNFVGVIISKVMGTQSFANPGPSTSSLAAAPSPHIQQGNEWTEYESR
jgi:hypothetical protein